MAARFKRRRPDQLFPNRRVKRSARPRWYAPARLLEAVRDAEGPFDLDACADPSPTAPRMADRTARADAGTGLKGTWKGRVFVNPQHGDAPLSAWLEKAVRQVHWEKTCRLAVALVPAEPESDWWTTYVRGWAGVCLVRGLLRFSNSNDKCTIGKPNFTSALVMYGDFDGLAAALAARPATVLDGLWLPAYRARSRQAPFLQTFTTREKMERIYGSFEAFRDNLPGWTEQESEDYAAALAETRPTPPPPQYVTDEDGFITHIGGRPLWGGES